MVADDLVRLPAEEPDGRPGQAFQPGPLGPCADDDQPPPRRRAGGDGLVNSLVRDQRGDAEVELLANDGRGGRRVKVGIDGRADHAARPAVAGGDPRRDGLADRDEVIDARRRGPVPGAEAVEHRAGDGPADGAIGPGL